MKNANIVLIRMREARYWPYHLDGDEARRIRAEDYAVQYDENPADVFNLLARIARTVERETARHG